MTAPRVIVQLTVTRVECMLDIDPRVTPLDALRDPLHLHGTKKGCDHGPCGACTVLIDGERRATCLMLAASAEGRRIPPFEGTSG